MSEQSPTSERGPTSVQSGTSEQRGTSEESGTSEQRPVSEQSPTSEQSSMSDQKRTSGRKLAVVKRADEARREAAGRGDSSGKVRESSVPGFGAGAAVPGPGSIGRRQALKVMAIAAAAPGLASCGPADGGLRAGAGSGTAMDTAGVPAGLVLPTSNPRAAGTPWDPDLVAPSVPWERTLDADELASLAVLCDVIIPADARSPSASQVGAHDFIDEWVSAPYDDNCEDAVLVRGGLVWLDAESARRFGAGLRFRDLTPEQQGQVCDDICYQEGAADGYEAAARFFGLVRDLTATAFWTTEEGMRDLEYVGNVPLARWDAPPPEVLRHIGVE